MGLINNVNVNVGGNGSVIDTISTYVTKVLKPNIINGKNILSQDMMPIDTGANTKYVIKYDFKLSEDITVPENCILEFDGGSIGGAYTITGTNTGIDAGLVKIFNTNVTIAGSWNVTKAYPEWFGAMGDGVTNDSTAIQKTIDSFKSIYFTSTYFLGVTVRVKHYSRLLGIGKIVCGENLNIGIEILSDDVEIAGITIEKKIPVENYAFHREALRGHNSNLYIHNCTIKGGITVYNLDDETTVVSNIIIDSNIIYADFSNLENDEYNQKDALAFYAVNDVYITKNRIVCKDVLRVLKSSAMTLNGDYSQQVKNPTHFVVTDNYFESNCVLGKQFWDMYCGTKDVYFAHNTVKITGHSCFIENKTTYNNNIPTTIIVEDNDVTLDNCTIAFISMTGEDVVTFSDNNIKHNNYTRNQGSFNILGANINLLHNIIQCTNYTSTFDLMQLLASAVGSNNIKHVSIKRNRFVNNKRIYINNVDTIVYEDNVSTGNDDLFYINKPTTLFCRIIELNGLIFQTNLSSFDSGTLYIELPDKYKDNIICKVTSNTAAAKKSVANVTKVINLSFTDGTNGGYVLKDTYTQTPPPYVKVGARTMYNGKPVWNNGTDWIDATGTTV